MEHIINEVLEYCQNDMQYLQDIINRLQDVVNDSENRTCSECGKSMNSGYCINNGEEYYCSDECLHKHYTDEEYDEMYDDGNGDSYYTEWEN